MKGGGRWDKQTLGGTRVNRRLKMAVIKLLAEAGSGDTHIPRPARLARTWCQGC
jgi:hypothetical protein